MRAMDHQQLFDRVWAYLVRLMNREVEKSNEAQVAKRLGVYPSTVGRWLRGDRGEGIKLSECLKIIARLGGSMAELVKELGDEEVARILELADEERQWVFDFLDILQSKGPEAEKVKLDVTFLKRSMSCRKE